MNAKEKLNTSVDIDLNTRSSPWSYVRGDSIALQYDSEKVVMLTAHLKAENMCAAHIVISKGQIMYFNFGVWSRSHLLQGSINDTSWDTSNYENLISEGLIDGSIPMEEYKKRMSYGCVLGPGKLFVPDRSGKPYIDENGYYFISTQKSSIALDKQFREIALDDKVFSGISLKVSVEKPLMSQMRLECRDFSIKSVTASSCLEKTDHSGKVIWRSPILPESLDRKYFAWQYYFSEPDNPFFLIYLAALKKDCVSITFLDLGTGKIVSQDIIKTNIFPFYCFNNSFLVYQDKEFRIIKIDPTAIKSEKKLKPKIKDFQAPTPSDSEHDFENLAGVKMIAIKPGKFFMGPEKNQHQVEISAPFWMSQTPITQKQWLSIMRAFHTRSIQRMGLFKGNENLPLDGVSVQNAKDFCKALNELCKSQASLPEGYEYQLPTEAQWEYACRAGSTKERYGALKDIAVYGKKKPLPVASKAPNAWGLYDMLGNIWEWCEDNYHPYPDSAQTDPCNTEFSVRGRVLRGGHWCSAGDDLGASIRVPQDFEDGAFETQDCDAVDASLFGFRIVLAPIRTLAND